MKKITILSSFEDAACLNDAGKIIDVPMDGNCGYHAFLLGLESTGNLNGINPKDILALRQKLVEFGEREFDQLQRKLKYNACLQGCKTDKLKYWKNFVLKRIYESNVDFNLNENKFVPQRYWWDCLETTGLVSSFFKINIIIYSLPNPRTMAFEYNEKEIFYIQIDGQNDLNVCKRFKKISNNSNTIHMIYTHNNHFKYLEKLL